jgi:hypothetical protein
MTAFWRFAARLARSKGSSNLLNCAGIWCFHRHLHWWVDERVSLKLTFKSRLAP